MSIDQPNHNRKQKKKGKGKKRRLQTIPSTSIEAPDNRNPHAIRSPNDRLGNGLERHVLQIMVVLLHLCDLVHVLQRQRRRRHVTGAPAAGFYSGGLLQVPRHRRRFHGELERVVLERRYRHRHGRVGFVLLGARVEVLAERHQVQTVLTQGGTHRRCRAGAAGGDSELDGRRHGAAG